MEGYYIMTLVWDEPTSGKVNQERTATLTFKRPDVRAVYVDWDDGESNKKTESNYQWVTSSEPIGSIAVKHTYNKQGDFKPVVQTVNSKGFVSRFYSNEATNTDVVPFSQDTGIAQVRINDDSPSALMRLENTTSRAGIDNSILEIEGPKKLYIAIAPTLTRTELTGTIKQVSLEVEAVSNRNKYDAQNGVESQIAMGSVPKQETFAFDINFTTASNQYGVYDFHSVMADNTNLTFSKVLKFKYISCKATGTTAANAGTDYTTNEVFNRLKIFLVTKAADGKFYPISYVSAGSPIKSVDESRYMSILDMGLSRTAASNATITDYRYDNGKLWFSPVQQWSLSTNILGTGTSNSTNPLLPVHYSYLTNPDGLNNIAGQKLFGVAGGATEYTWYITGTTSGNIRQDSVAIDDYGRFYDQYYCVRDSVMASTLSGSILTTNQPEVFRVYPTPGWGAAATCTQTPVTSYTSEMKNNGSSNVFKLSSVNTTAQTDILGNAVMSQSAEYILLTFDNKTNKVFFNNTNYANGLISDLAGLTSLSGLKIAGVEYLHIDDVGGKKQNAYWKPLEFRDTTRIEREYRDTGDDVYYNFHNSFSKSGFIEYSMPTDWTATSITKLCGGVYNTASGNFAACTATGTNDTEFAGITAVTNVAGSDGYGDKVTLTIGSAAQTALGTIGSADDIGRFKYIAILHTTSVTASGAAFWIASGASNGWNGSDKLTLQVGTTGTSTENVNYDIPVNGDAADIRLYVRRVNIYDVIGGAEKVFSDNREVGATGSANLLMAGAETYNPGTSYFKNLYNATDSDLTGSSWATNDKYVLKLTLSGATSAGTSGNPCPEIWNVFDANQGHSAIVKSVDDSAYNLNSLAITSSIGIGRRGQYFKAITHRGKVFVTKTGVGLSEVGFSSVALGDEKSSTAFDDHGPSSLYGHLHMIRKIQSEAIPVYWDEPQKDGTFVRLWGTVLDVNETRGVGGPQATMNFTFTLAIEKVAVLSNVGKLMTGIFPLGGIASEFDYS
jgi:hypothetical protein